MAGDTQITVVGNLVDDPELRFTPSGAAVANFRIASTPRTFDKQSNEWKDGEALFLSCSVWRQAAENVAESLQKGMRVVVQGRAQARVVRDPRGREAHRLRDRGRRGRPLAEVRHRQGHPHPALGRRRRTAAASRVAAAHSARPTTTRGPPRQAGGPQGGGSGGAPANDPWATPGVGTTSRRSDSHRSRPTAPTTTEYPSKPTIPARAGLLRGSTTMAKAVMRKPKKKVCQFCKEKATGVDYKDTTLLRKFISDRGKIRARRVTGNCVQHQRDVAIAVKNARELALLPYTSTGR